MAKTVAASSTLIINKPIAEVFAFLANGENDPTWRTGVKSIRRIGDLKVGARYEQKVSGPGGRDISADIEITKFEPNKCLAFQTIAGPVRPSGEYCFETSGAGTKVTFSLAAELGGLKALAMGAMVQKTMDSEVAALAKAKAHLEGAK